MADYGDKPYNLFLHRECVTSKDASAMLRADELRNEAVDVGQGMASHTKDSVEINGVE